MRLRSFLRHASPYWLRVAVALAQQKRRDRAKPRPRFTVRDDDRGAEDFPHLVAEVVQEIKAGAFREGKLVNIRLGAERLHGVAVRPGETLSFWRLVGPPTAKAGFQTGRSIRGGLVGEEVGGGLCQVSGIVYEVALRAGFDVAVRHPHSRDLYSEEERFTPLGLDATVVWPFKDLRLVNASSWPLQLRVVVRDMTLTASVRAPTALKALEVAIERTDREGVREVEVFREGERISSDLYAITPDH